MRHHRHLLLALPLVFALTIHAKEPSPKNKLELKKWSADVNVPDPVSVSMDPQGRIYVTQTTRRKVADLDIREHPQWIPFDVALESIDQKEAFLKDVLAPGKLKHPEGDLKDHNKDGSIDWKDLTVHTERIYRLEDTTGSGVADKKTAFAEGFNTPVTGIAAGVLWFDGYVYTTIAPDLWRLRDTKGTGVADEREAIVHGFGHHIAYAGHDMHGLCIGLDGRIYWTIGDKGVNVHTKDGRHVMEPHQGCVLRCEPDGTGFEIFAHGIRNTQEIAFDDYGNIFGVDNDSDRPTEKERVVYLTEQSDSGWRCYYQYMSNTWVPWMNEGLWKPRFEGQPEYITPPLANANDGPCGFAHNPGTALSPEWKNCFFYNQFPAGKMNVIRVAPAGAAFKVLEDSTVTSGVIGIGMTWSPDGRLFMADWAGGYPLKQKGAVWSVDDAKGAGSAARVETKKIITEGYANRTPVELTNLLAHADQRVRRDAQFQLVKLGEFASLRQTALDSKQTTLARIHALWGLGQGLRGGKLTVDDAQNLLALMKDKDAEVRAQLAKIIGDAASCASLGEALIPFLKDESPRVQFLTAITLGKLKTTEAAEALFAMIRKNNDADAYIRHAGVTGLAGCASREQLVKMKTNPSRALRVAAVLALRRDGDSAVADFLHDTDDGIVSEAARAIHDDLSIKEALPKLAALLDEERGWPEAVTRRVLNSAFRIGDASNASRVIKFALNTNADPNLREEALTLAKLWSTPPPLDRVDGRARKLDARAPELMIGVAQPRIDELMALGDTKLKTIAIQILTTYKLPVAAPIAAAAVMEPKAPVEVRIEALRLLADQHPATKELKETLDSLFSGTTKDTLRVEALNVQLAADKTRAAVESTKLLDKGTTLEKQIALLVLAQTGREDADATLRHWLDELSAGKVKPELQLEVIEAAQARDSLKDALAAFEAKRAAGTTAAYAECLEGGDAKAGKDIALNSLATNCTACHRFDKREGSNVGPPLEKIATIRDRAYLLESLIVPNAKIAPGYGYISVTLKNGSNVSGALVTEKPGTREVELRLPDGTTQKIPKAAIASQTEPMSVMPPMGAILTKRQVRDVVAFLSSLKGSSKKEKKPTH